MRYSGLEVTQDEDFLQNMDRETGEDKGCKGLGDETMDPSLSGYGKRDDGCEGFSAHRDGDEMKWGTKVSAG